ncbi:MAG TPA: response regulator [Candidatus Paceibacterota bacterium]
MTTAGENSILLVDDDRFILDLYSEAFENGGFKTDTALGAAEALKKMRAGSFSVVILDVNMVAVDGIELLEMVRKEKLLPKALFMMLTNDANPDKIKKAHELGAEAYLVKIATPPELAVKKVSEVLQTKAKI